MLRPTRASAALLLAVVMGPVTAAENEGSDAARPATALYDRLTDGAVRPAPPEVPSDDEAEGIVPRNPRVLFITSQGCERCARDLARLRRPGGDFEAMQSRGWKIGPEADCHLQIVDRTSIPELVARLDVREYPTVACVDEGEIVRSFKYGCTTPLDSWTFGWLLKGKNERPHAHVPEPVRVDATGSYRLRGNHWSVDGDWNPTRVTLISHLRGPNHAGQLATDWQIEKWSYEELRSVHDDLHERELANSPASYSTGSSYSYGAGGSSGQQFGAGRKMMGR